MAKQTNQVTLPNRLIMFHIHVDNFESLDDVAKTHKF